MPLSDSEVEQAILAYLAIAGEPVKTWTVINDLSKQEGRCHWRDLYERRKRYSRTITQLRRAGKIIRDKSQNLDTIELDEESFTNR